MNLILLTYQKGRQEVHSFVNPQEIVSIDMDPKNSERSWVSLTDGREIEVRSHYTAIRNLALGQLGQPDVDEDHIIEILNEYVQAWCSEDLTSKKEIEFAHKIIALLT